MEVCTDCSGGTNPSFSAGVAQYENGTWRRLNPHWEVWVCNTHLSGSCSLKCPTGYWDTSIWARWSHGR